MAKKRKKKKYVLEMSAWRVVVDDEYVYLEPPGVERYFTFPTQLLRTGPDAGTTRPHVTGWVRGEKRRLALDATTMELIPVRRGRKNEWPGVVKLRRSDLERFIVVMRTVLAETLFVGLRTIGEDELRETFPLMLTPDASWYDRMLKKAVSESSTGLKMNFDPFIEGANDLELEDVLRTPDEAIHIVRDVHAVTGVDSVMVAGFKLPDGVDPDKVGSLDDMESYQLIWRRLPDGGDHWTVYSEAAIDRGAARRKMLEALGPKLVRAVNNVLSALGVPDALDLDDLDG